MRVDGVAAAARARGNDMLLRCLFAARRDNMPALSGRAPTMIRADEAMFYAFVATSRCRHAGRTERDDRCANMRRASYAEERAAH